MSNSRPTVKRTYTPQALAEAQQLGVDLEQVQPARQWVNVHDVRAAARQRSAPRAEAPARRQKTTVQSRWDPQQTIDLDVFGPNPLVEDARQTCAAYGSAVREAPTPTLFADGDLPPFTASGVDPRELRKVPWFARHAVAAAASPATVLAAIEHFAHDLDDPFGEYQHSGAGDYVMRVSNWLRGVGVDRAAYTAAENARYGQWLSENGMQ